MKAHGLVPLLKNWEWQRQGNCAVNKVDTNVFFLEPNDRQSIKRKKIAEAKKVCVGCPVIKECLDMALQTGDIGVFGGTTEEERKKMKKNV